MGIPGILKEIGKGERKALSKLAIEHLERHNRPLRIAIDAAIWNFQTQSGQGGKNPALRTLFFRLLRLLALPIQPVFVYDGRNKPLTKRGRTVTKYGGTCVPNELSKGLVARFSYPWHTAPGEAEAECALLQKRGVVDAVMSQDVDAIMFGSRVTFRDWSKEGTRGNKAPTHVNVIDSERLREISGLDPNGMILVALLSGGDYDEAGVAGFGSALACEVARAGFGDDLIDLVNKEDWSGLNEWRERLAYELETNESGFFKRKHKTLKVPENFPDLKILGYYVRPAVSRDEDLPDLQAKWSEVWTSEIDVPALRQYTASMFDWQWRSGARRFVRCFAQPLLQDRLRRGTITSGTYSVNSIIERRQHFVNDGIPELRLVAVPAHVVDIDIEAEEENPEFTAEQNEGEDEDALEVGEEAREVDAANEELSVPPSPSKRRKSPPWDPYVSEKWWIPETLLQLGLPAIVEDWHQLQQDRLADPKKFATRKTVKQNKSVKQIDASMRTGALRGFLTNIKKGNMDLSSSKLDGVKGISGKSNPFPTVSDMEAESESMLDDDLPSISHLCRSRADKSTQSDLEDSDRPGTHSKDIRGSSVEDSNQTTSRHRFLTPTVEDGSMRDISNPILIDSSSGESSSLGVRQAPRPLPSDKDMSHVTQRRTRRARFRHEEDLENVPSSPTRTRRPIESFFSSSSNRVVQTSFTKVKPTASTASSIPAQPSTGLLSHAITSKSTALARDSLPGAWKEFEANSASNKRAPRVSYIDLTGD